MINEQWHSVLVNSDDVFYEINFICVNLTHKTVTWMVRNDKREWAHLQTGISVDEEAEHFEETVPIILHQATDNGTKSL
jgi:hypothetical protein